MEGWPASGTGREGCGQQGSLCHCALAGSERYWTRQLLISLQHIFACRQEYACSQSQNSLQQPGRVPPRQAQQRLQAERHSRWPIFISCRVDLSPSDEYDADPVETKVCLELDCSPSVACCCMDCLCCSVCSARCDCVGATKDPDTALQRLLRPNYCYSYQLVNHIIIYRLFSVFHPGV